MLSNAQKGLLKRAQAEVALSDLEYRAALATVSGMADCRSSTDARLTDGHVDRLLSYFEAILWRKVDAGELQASCKPNAVFRKRGFWAGRNRQGNTSRDRHVEQEAARQVVVLEGELHALGFGFAYLSAIENRIVPWSVVNYLAALKRTLLSKRKKLTATVS